MKKFIKRIMKELKNDAVYKREIDKDGVITIYCDTTFTVWKKDKGSNDFDIVAPADASIRHSKLRVNAGDTVELVTEGNFSFDFIEVPSRKEIPTGEKLLELVENKPDNIKDIIRAQVLAEMSNQIGLVGGETIEEFDDFSHMEDEFNDAPLSNAEMQLMAEEYEAIQSDELYPKQQDGNPDGQTLTVEGSEASLNPLEANQTSVNDTGSQAPAHNLSSHEIKGIQTV